MRQPIPNICLKAPTGGGKTLLAATALERIHTGLLKRQTGLVRCHSFRKAGVYASHRSHFTHK